MWGLQRNAWGFVWSSEYLDRYGSLPGVALALGGAQQRAVLALLVIAAPESVSRDRLVDELWGERPPASAGHAIQVYVSSIRKVLREGRRWRG